MEVAFNIWILTSTGISDEKIHHMMYVGGKNTRTNLK